LAREGNDIGSLEHRPKICSVGHGRRPNDILEMRPVRVEDVIMPVRF
jgi:hypothetical protein